VVATQPKESWLDAYENERMFGQEENKGFSKGLPFSPCHTY
jgi:hypothetical protein